MKYLANTILKTAHEKQWLINEIKYNPKKMAANIVHGVELAASQAEMGIDSDSDTISVLLNNVKLIGQQLISDETDDADLIDAEEAVLTIEKELRNRTGHVTSSKVAGGFINQILTLITSFSDQVKASRISHEFLKGESGLLETERILQSMATDTDPKETMLIRLYNMIVEQGVDEKDVTRLLKQVRGGTSIEEKKRGRGNWSSQCL